MNMSSIIPSIVLVLISILPCLGLAYEIETHSEMSAKALDASTLAKDPLVLKNLGLQTGQSFPDSNNIPSNIEVLFRTGARFEDNLSITNLRPINHFFDPTSE